MRKDIETVISYWKDPSDGSGPDINFDNEILHGHRDEDNRKVLVHDTRGLESKYSLDTNGFACGTLPDRNRPIPNDVTSKVEYYQEIEEYLLELTGAKKVMAFGLIMRGLARGALKPHEHQYFKEGQDPRARGAGPMILSPSPHPHVDYGPMCAEDSIRRMGPEAVEMLKNASRYQLLNVWRPLKPIQRDPLTFMDWKSATNSDYHDISREKSFGADMKIFVTIVGPGDGGHRWHYWSDMTPNEVIIFKQYDTKQDIAWRCAHTSVEIPGTEDLPPRESVEVRALICY